MYFDRQNMLDDAANLTVSRVSTNVMRARSGVGEEVLIKVFVNNTFGGPDTATLNVKIITSAHEDLSSPTVLQDLPVPIPVTSLIAGFSIEIKVQSEFFEGFIGLQYDVANGPLTTGVLTAVVCEATETWKPYARAYIVP